MHVTTKGTTYQGNPTLEFTNGSGRPFSLGAYKLRVILSAMPDVVSWLESRGETIPTFALPLPGQTTRAETTATGQPHLSDGLLSDLATRIEALETTLANTDASLVARIEPLEQTIGIILAEITASASAAPAEKGTRSLQID